MKNLYLLCNGANKKEGAGLEIDELDTVINPPIDVSIGAAR